MDAQELSNLQEAYLGVCASQKELLNERLRRFPTGKVWAKQEKIQNTLSNPNLSRQEREKLSRRWSDMDDVRQDMNSPGLPISQHTPQGSRAKSLANKNRPESEKRSKTVEPPIRRFPNRLMRGDRQGIHDSYDFYDIILSHLLDEGYAETPEAAEKIMIHMSENWKESIVEEEKPLPVGRMDRKAEKLNKEFLNSEPGSPAARLISRASHITGTRDKKIV